LWDADLQAFFSAVSLTTLLCISIYVSARILAWLLYAVVMPSVVWLLYAAVHGLAWLLRTVIVPGTLWLLYVAVPVLARLLYTAVCGLTRQLQDLGRSRHSGRVA
jgi:hypothetical protein